MGRDIEFYGGIWEKTYIGVVQNRNAYVGKV